VTSRAWLPDPTGKHDHRWWDGEQWTEHVADAGEAAVDPIAAGEEPPPPAGPETGTSGEPGGGTGSSDAGGRGGDTGDGGAASSSGATEPVWEQQDPAGTHPG
jgi:hypothetical protein